MRALSLALFATFAVGCAAHTELVRAPAISDPSMGREEAALGIVRYPLGGDRSDQRQRRSDAYLEMHDACSGEPAVMREHSEAGWRVLHFRCRGPLPPHPSELPEDQKPCCSQMELSCGNPSCTCDQTLCPQE